MSKKTIDIKGIEDKLRSYNVLLIQIENLKIDLEGYIDRQTIREISIGSKSNNPLPGRVTVRPAVSQVENVVIGSITDLDRKYFKLKEYEGAVKKIDNVMDKLSDRDRMLVKGFYMEKLSLVDIGIRLDRTPQHLCSIKRNILEKYFTSIN